MSEVTKLKLAVLVSIVLIVLIISTAIVKKTTYSSNTCCHPSYLYVKVLEDNVCKYKWIKIKD